MKQDSKTFLDTNQDHGLSKNPIILKPKLTSSSINIPKFHWVKDKVDKRDYRYSVSSKPSIDLVDLRQFCSPIENQENLGSCTGQAIAGAIELLNKRNGKYNDISRLFIYYYERLLINTVHYDSGAYIRDGIKSCFHNGASLESLWPYDISKFRVKPSLSSIQDANNRKVTLYERVKDHDGCIDALSNGYPVIVGFYVYSSFCSYQVSRTGIMPYPNVKKERLLGGHAVLLVGYNKKQSRYIVRNSWGGNWGDAGYFYMPFQVIQNKAMSEDFWVIKSVNNP